MILKCVIVDDEPLAINIIKNYLAQIKSFELVNTFSNALDCISYLKENPVDLLFLDINMPLLDGLSFLKSLAEKPMVIITTAHAEFALKGYELEVLDYLIKPISFERFVMSANKAMKTYALLKSEKGLMVRERPYIFVKIDKKKMKKIFLDEILVVESLKDYIKIITPLQKYIVHQTLGSFTDELPSDRFIRIHRSYTIPIDKVETVEGNSVEIAGIRYTIGRSYLNDVKKVILNDFSGDDDLTDCQ